MKFGAVSELGQPRESLLLVIQNAGQIWETGGAEVVAAWLLEKPH